MGLDDADELAGRVVFVGGALGRQQSRGAAAVAVLDYLEPARAVVGCRCRVAARVGGGDHVAPGVMGNSVSYEIG